jgi:hypothetical protein
VANSKQRRFLRRHPSASNPQSDRTPAPELTEPDKQEAKSRGKPVKKLSSPAKKRIFDFGTALAVLTAVFSLFPHLTLSEPVTMDSSRSLSKYITVTNDGILPVFRVYCGLAIQQLTLPGNLRVTTDADDFAVRFTNKNCDIGSLSPGDAFTFTPDNLLWEHWKNAESGDFAIVISYIPILPPVRMDSCTHFTLYRDTSGQRSWFRSPGHCNKFPWFHWWGQHLVMHSGNSQ